VQPTYTYMSTEFSGTALCSCRSFAYLHAYFANVYFKKIKKRRQNKKTLKNVKNVTKIKNVNAFYIYGYEQQTWSDFMSFVRN